MPDGGRAPDIDTLRGLFTTGRLTTVTGPPAAGKTAAAAAAADAADAAADSFADGTHLVPLRELPDEALLAHAVMRAAGVRDRPGMPQADALCYALRDSQSLLVLDGCEHLLRGCAALVRRLLRDCPRLHIAVISGEPLGVEGERTFPIAPGPARPGEVPASGAPGTMAAMAAVGRSHQLCSPPERLLWARLSVTGADFTLYDAVLICADRHLPAAGIPGAARALARRSLLLEDTGTGRFRLSGPVRDYGTMMLRELGEEEEASARRRYRSWLRGIRRDQPDESPKPDGDTV